MSKQKILQPFLYHNFERVFEDEVVYTASFPVQWWQVIEEEKKEFILPFKPELLARRLFSIFPEIIMIQNKSKMLSQGLPWIISKEPISDKAILVVALTCIKYSKLKNKDKLELTAKLNWKKNSLRDLQEPDYFQIYPALIAHHFSAEPREIGGINALEDRKIKFYPVHSGQCFEAVSEPISLSSKSDKFSYVIKFELITRGLENRTLLKITPGSRRYYQRPGKKPIFDVKSRVKSSIYISQNHLLTKSDSQLKSFGKFYFCRKGNQLVWEDSSGEIIKELYPELLSIEELLPKASEFINGKGVLIGYSDKAFTKGTRVKPGISVQERNGLVTTLRDAFPTLIQVDDHFEVRLPRRVNANKTYKFLNSNDTNELNFHSYVSDKLFEESLLVWKEKGYLQYENGNIILNSEPKMNIKFFTHGNEMIHELPMVEGDKSKAIKEYKKEMQVHLPKVKKNVRTSAFIEIEPYHEMRNNEKDSKLTLRGLFAEKGITSQFIHPLEHSRSDYKSRINSAFLDLITDSSLTHVDFEEPMFKDNTILSLSLIKKNSKQFLPVFSKVKDGVILFKTLGDSQWVEIQKYLTNNYSSSSFIDKDKSPQLKRWMESTIIEELSLLDKDKNLFFVIDAALRRYWIKELSNYQLETGKNPFQEWEIFNIDRVKVIRINLTQDVPNYLISNNDDGNNYATGLFKNKDGIYYSVGMKTSGLRVNSAASRIENQHHKPFGKQVAVEIIPVNYCSEEEQDLMASFIHKLRHMALNFDPALRYPVMMHLAVGVKKYFDKDFEYDDYAEDFDDALIIEDTEGGQLKLIL